MSRSEAAPLAAYAAGFAATETELRLDDLPIAGRMPNWLAGSYIRTSAVAFQKGEWVAEHWFDGLAMLSTLHIGDGRVRFINRFIESDECKAARAGHAPFAGAFRVARRSLANRLSGFLPPSTDNANISVATIGGRYVALGESRFQIDFDPATLATLGHHRYDDALPVGASLIAHPARDPERREWTSLAIDYQRASVIAYRLADGSNARQLIGTWRTRRMPYIHSLALTRSHVIIVDQPLRADLFRMGMNLGLGRRAFFQCFAWEKGTPTRLVLLDRSSGAVRTSETDPLFAFHTVNAYDEGGTIVLDLVAIDEAPDLSQLRFDRLLAGGPTQWPRLRRIRILPDGRSRAETIGDIRFDFPTIDERRSTSRHRFVYGLGPDPAVPRDFTSILRKLNVETGEARAFQERGFFPGEPVFVPRPGGTAEDDGVLLTLGLAAREARSLLLVLDARTLEEQARATLPIVVPFGFHGRFFPVFRPA
jgi:beta,beta-carotene 9',10'-dioxygenase